jgi:hypothetical protein
MNVAPGEKKTIDHDFFFIQEVQIWLNKRILKFARFKPPTSQGA